jgi:hypothetical protein
MVGKSIENKDLAYIAGFFDGEGGICIGKHGPKGKKYLQLHVSFTNTNRLVLIWMKEVLGIKGRLRDKVHGQNLKLNITMRCYELIYTGHHAGDVLKKILPFLMVKKGEAEIAIRFQDSFVRDNWSRVKTSQEVIISDIVVEAS